ncbi:MAG TPA: DUF983 domain-containing protein [Bacteroidia bacterium]
MKKPISLLISDIAKQKCPCCGKGQVFEKQHLLSLNIPKMHDKCTSCGYYFEREPGYFLGAMYVSYGLAVLQGILAFLLAATIFPSLSTFGLMCIVMLVIVAFAFFNYKFARVIWLYIFPQ